MAYINEERKRLLESTGAMSPSASIATSAAAAASSSGDPAELARQKARELSARLSGGASAGSTLGKHKRDDDSGAGGGAKRKKVFVPVKEQPDVDFAAFLQGAVQRQLEIEAGARLLVSGKGAKDVSPEEESEELHIVVVGETDEQVDKASKVVEEVLHSADRRAALKEAAARAPPESAADASGASASAQATAPISAQAPAPAPAPAPASAMAVAAAPSAQSLRLPDSLYAPSAMTGQTARDFFSRGRGGGGMGLGASQSKILKVSPDRAGLIIGKGGETIKTLQTVTGASIQVAREMDMQGMRTVTISGTEESIMRAEQEIMALVSGQKRVPVGVGPAGAAAVLGYDLGSGGGSGGGSAYGPGPSAASAGYGAPASSVAVVSSSLGPAGEHRVVLHVPNSIIGGIIGKSGDNIKSLQMRTGASIQVARESDMAPGEQHRVVTLSGSPESVAMAQREIESHMRGGGGGAPASGPDASGTVRELLRVPDQHVGSVIGRGGETIKVLQQQTGAVIQVSKDRMGPEREILIIGSAHAVEHAKREINSLVEEKRRVGGNVMLGGGSRDREYDRDHGSASSMYPGAAGGGYGAGGANPYGSYYPYDAQYAQYAAAYGYPYADPSHSAAGSAAAPHASYDAYAQYYGQYGAQQAQQAPAQAPQHGAAAPHDQASYYAAHGQPAPGGDGSGAR